MYNFSVINPQVANIDTVDNQQLTVINVDDTNNQCPVDIPNANDPTLTDNPAYFINNNALLLSDNPAYIAIRHGSPSTATSIDTSHANDQDDI